MKTITVNTWKEAKDTFLDVDNERTEMIKQHGLNQQPSSFLYRGQSNADWLLKTTLERASNKITPVTDYYRHVLITRPQVEAFSNSRWEMMELEEYTKWAESRSDLNWADYPGYEYMIYLRHHGFPSPLMDWTMSPYVAAYFAYSNVAAESSNVAIYCYSESLGAGKSWSNDEPSIAVKGPYARSHKRHFLQQCKYTVCSKPISNELSYASHEDVFQKNNQTQDLLWKIVIPRITAPEALKDLDSMNVNALSLFGSEDSLIQTLSMRQFFIMNE